MSVRKAMKGLLRGSVPTVDEHSEVRRACLLDLRKLFENLQKQRVRKIDQNLARELGIIQGRLPSSPMDSTLDSLNRPLFYKSMTISRVEELRPYMEDPETAMGVELQEGIWEENDLDYIDSGEIVDCMLIREFDQFGRTTATTNCDDDNFLSQIFRAFGNVTDIEIEPWATDIRHAAYRQEEPYGDGKPHVMCSMIQHSLPTESLLRTEVLTIIGIIITRLGVQSLSAHIVIPVNVLSCFDGYKARIIQAHMTEHGLLAIYHTRLYDFITPESRLTSVPACLGYMASDPIGDTKTLEYTAKARSGEET
ncbi:hypothetical protein BJX76DRAFT_355310 [Aspergillus varians]